MTFGDFILKSKKSQTDLQLFSSQNSDLGNEQLDEIGQEAQAKNIKSVTKRGVKKTREMVEEKKNYSKSNERE